MNRTVFRVDIPEDEWEENSALDNPSDCLYTTLRINGTLMHLEAWAVTLDDEHCQVPASDYEESFDQLYGAVSADGNFTTTEIRGREYVLVASPYC